LRRRNATWFLSLAGLNITSAWIENNVSPYLIASIYSALGEKDQAFQWLEKAYDRRDAISYLLADPMMDPLCSDPRFDKMIQRMHLPK